MTPYSLSASFEKLMREWFPKVNNSTGTGMFDDWRSATQLMNTEQADVIRMVIGKEVENKLMER